MNLIYSRPFLKSVNNLPQRIQEKLAKQLKTLQQNPFHPLLHTKPLTGKLVGFYSFRITREWRVIFQFERIKSIKLIKAAHRREIYK